MLSQHTMEHSWSALYKDMLYALWLLEGVDERGSVSNIDRVKHGDICCHADGQDSPIL